MKKIFLLLFFLAPYTFSQSPAFEDYFLDKTMRIDYFHNGTKTTEFFSFDQIYEYSKWSGNKARLIDDRNLGEYCVKIYDSKTGKLIYSMGYCTIFNEWQTTDEAIKGLFRTFSETILIPFPKNEIKFTICRRNKKVLFEEIFSANIDPKDPIVNRESRNPGFKVNKIIDNGPVDKKIDLVILGDGYTQNDIPKFHKDVEYSLKALFNNTPFKERKSEFNVYTIDVISEDSGIDNPVKNIWKKTALSTTYNSFGSQRYIILADNKAVRDIAGEVPYDYLYILTNSDEYGGGAIFNLYATSYTVSLDPKLEWQKEYVFVHEFGHSFAGLGDEYYTSDVAYNDFYPEGVEPWEPNLSRLLDKNNLKWKKYMDRDTPSPTPWGKAEYDEFSNELRKIKRSDANYATKRKEITDKQQEMKEKQKYAKKIGYFEGGGYASKGIYRPYIDCKMFSLSLIDFCPVCRSAIENTIDFFTK